MHNKIRIKGEKRKNRFPNPQREFFILFYFISVVI